MEGNERRERLYVKIIEIGGIQANLCKNIKFAVH